MPLKNVHYQRLETEESEVEEDEAPPTHVQLNGYNHVKGTLLTRTIIPLSFNTELYSRLHSLEYQ